MICPFPSRTVLSLLFAATTVAVALPAEAITPNQCSARLGGNGGGRYFTGWTTGAYLAQIVVWHGDVGFGNVINGLEPVWCAHGGGGQVVCEVELIGRQLGTRSSFSLNWQAGERLSVVSGRSGKYLDELAFGTNWGKGSGAFGGRGGAPFALVSPMFTFWNDFWGTSGSVVDSLGACSSFE
jgi:hypothetical protein